MVVVIIDNIKLIPENISANMNKGESSAIKASPKIG
jgi:hypothetical protein